MRDKQVMFSTLWVFAMFNYLYADVFGLMDGALLRQLLSGRVGGIEITPSFLFGGAVLMEIPIAMVVLSRVLEYRANRWANISAGTIKTIAVVASMFVGTPTSYYLFFGCIEIACSTFIVLLAWRWAPPSV